ncbi:MAG: IS1595 family transposase, partial [Sporolactobacillus sp.]
AYLDEFCYRFNRRHFEGEFFHHLLSSCAVTLTVTYHELTG